MVICGYLPMQDLFGLILKKSFKNYTVEDGLKTNQFNYKSSYKAPDGTLYFGSIDGFVRFILRMKKMMSFRLLYLRIFI